MNRFRVVIVALALVMTIPALAGQSGKPEYRALPEGVVYCGGDVEQQITFSILADPPDQWDAMVNVNDESLRAMTAYSFFGKAEVPEGFLVALLGEDRSEFLVFRDGEASWIEYGDHRYEACD
jgi:hypothetical protein